jgi:YVTN family beta-propeller protein
MAACALAAIALCVAGCDQPLDERYAYREYVYVSNGGSNDVSVIDGLAFKVIKTIPVGKNPSGIAANPKKNEIYVVNTESNNLSVIDAEKNVVVATIGLHRSPFFISVSPDGTRGYVANSGSNNVSVIDLVTRKVISNISVGIAPGMAVVSNDGKAVVAPLRGENALAVIDVAGMQLRSKVSMSDCAQPGDVTILPDSSKAFVACSGGSQVAAVQLKNPALKQDDDRLLAMLNVGKTPVHLALKPDGGEIFVSNFDSGTFSEIGTQANEVGGSYLIGTNPVRGLVGADNATLYVSNFGSDTVAVYDITINRLLASIQVGSRPESLTLSSNHNYLLVANTRSGDVSIIRTAIGTTEKPRLFTMIPVGSKPNAMVLKAFAVKK